MVDLGMAQRMIHDYHTLMGENPVGTNAEIMKALMSGNSHQATLAPLEGQTLMARYGSLPVRGDVAKEALKSLDPRYQVAADAMAKGHTPYSVVFNDIINSANGPWIQMLNDAVFPGNVDEAIATGQQTMQSIIDSAPNK